MESFITKIPGVQAATLPKKVLATDVFPVNISGFEGLSFLGILLK